VAIACDETYFPGRADSSSMRGLSVLLAALLVFAGCVGSTDDVDPASVDEPEARDESVNRSLFLTKDLGLTETEASGDPAAVPAGSFYTAWTRGGEQPTWTGSAPETPIVVENATLTFYYTSESATVTTGPQDQGFPEFVVYFGTEASPAAWASVSGPDVVQEGEVVEASATLNVPEGGLFLPADADPVVKLAPVQGQGSAEDTRLEFLVNGTDTPSRVTFDGDRANASDTQRETVVDATGVLAGSAYAVTLEGASAQSFPVTVDEETAGLDARLERQTGAGIADIDLQLLGPDGDVVAQSVTPEDDEGLTLRQANVDAIGTGEWTLRAVNYGNAAVQFSLSADVLEQR